jgi:hypothetical protein
MTAISAVLPAARRYESPRRILAVTRLHFVNKFQILVLPLIILGGIFLINLAIWYIIIDSTGGPTPQNLAHTHLGYTGAVSYIFIYVMIIAVQAISRTFPFSLGFGVTRRDFYLGSALAFVTLALGFAVVLTVMSVIEIATGGWGVGGRMFAPLYFTNSFWLLRFVMYFCAFLFVLFIGSAAATMFVRWRATGLTAFFAIIAVILLGAIAYVTLDHQWPAVGTWFTTSGPVGVTLWTLVPSVVAGVAGFFILRRATPRN